MVLHQRYYLKPIGIVRSLKKRSEEVPIEGVRAEIDVFDEFRAALEGINSYTHLIILSFLNEAERGILKAKTSKGHNQASIGVFALRSSSRPNPIVVNIVRRLAQSGNTLTVEPLDLYDGTPVIDIKPYVGFLDCIFSAKGLSRPYLPTAQAKSIFVHHMLREAANFHGHSCAGVAIGIRLVQKATEYYRCDPKDSQLRAVSGVKACIADGVQASLGATNKRYRALGKLDQTVTFVLYGAGLRLTVSSRKIFHTPEEVLIASEEELMEKIEKFPVRGKWPQETEGK